LNRTRLLAAGHAALGNIPGGEIGESSGLLVGKSLISVFAGGSRPAAIFWEPKLAAVVLSGA
jgi:hypothetical protein